MNHIAAHKFSTDARPLNRRAMAKLRTRQALLQAGKQLFTERGYEDATVRDIARAAGMSTGAVFANFSDKADLFAEILSDDYEALASAMRDIVVENRPVRDALTAVLKAGYAFYLAQLPLLQAANSVSWSHTAKDEERRRADLRQVLSIVEDILRRGVQTQQLAAKTDVELTADLIWQAYRSNFRLAVFDGYDEGALVRRTERQLDLILNAVKVG